MVGRLTPSLEIVGAYSLDSLARTAISPTFSPADSAVYLVDSAGHILYQNVPAGTKVSPIPGLSEIAASQGGVNDPSLDNSLSINYTPVPGLSWTLAAQDLGQSLSDPYLNTPLNAPLALIPIGLFALIALVFGITQVTGPLKKLERQVTQSAWRSNGKLPDSVGGITEIRDLGAIMLAVDEHHQRKVTDLEGFIQATTGLPADQRLGAALQNRVQQVQKASDIQVTIEISGKPHNLPVEQEISLYKVACEALENILQHSQARQGWVHLQYGDGEVWLEVRDDGQGFVLPKSPSTLTRTGKFGLASMADQAAESGARLEIDTTPGHGTSIRMAIPNALPRSENSLQKSA
jgi:anti-sigma regulatory factor (Ser/Thr protein kinase)